MTYHCKIVPVTKYEGMEIKDVHELIKLIEILNATMDTMTGEILFENYLQMYKGIAICDMYGLALEVLDTQPSK